MKSIRTSCSRRAASAALTGEFTLAVAGYSSNSEASGSGDDAMGDQPCAG